MYRQCPFKIRNRNLQKQLFSSINHTSLLNQSILIGLNTLTLQIYHVLTQALQTEQLSDNAASTVASEAEATPLSVPSQVTILVLFLSLTFLIVNESLEMKNKVKQKWYNWEYDKTLTNSTWCTIVSYILTLTLLLEKATETYFRNVNRFYCKYK